ncbi:type II toxin-antitoxin system prevent-host-death family antitoxin [Corynebacterium phoceense]|uniref:type II toxin-antitoxin system prevent-host-death family antitoxin n=2 Tax=Corynebacterium TaxID=1716 RepID=UPI003BF5F157
MQREHRDELGVTIDESRFTGKRTIVTRNGKRVAAIVPVNDLERFEELASFLCWSLRRSM